MVSEWWQYTAILLAATSFSLLSIAVALHTRNVNQREHLEAIYMKYTCLLDGRGCMYDMLETNDTDSEKPCELFPETSTCIVHDNCPVSTRYPDDK